MATHMIRWRSGIETSIHLNSDLSVLPDFLADRPRFIMADHTFWDLHGASLPFQADYLIHAAESNKSMETVTDVYEALQRSGVDRHSVFVAIGGGITTDLGGFVASTYMRGMPLILCPTTLLAQVDAAIGGKTGVNVRNVKNAAGTFCQPEHVLLDHGVLRTLDVTQLKNGMAECIKHACIADDTLFRMFEEWNPDPASLAIDPAGLGNLIDRSIHTKTSVVQQDEREHGLRRILNFGHTIGHAIELTENIPHGYAVSVGMVFAARMSEHLGTAEAGLADRIREVLHRWSLPTDSSMSADELMNTIRLDKKKQTREIAFVMLERIGKPVIVNLPLGDLEERLRALCQSG